MAFVLNPMGINGPAPAPNATQTDYRNPSVSAAVASYPVGSNMLLLTWPIPAYVQPNILTSVPASQLNGGALGISNPGH